MLFYQRHVGKCYLTSDILVHVILLTLFWYTLFYEQHFGACYFTNDTLAHVIVQTTFWHMLFYQRHLMHVILLTTF